MITNSAPTPPQPPRYFPPASYLNKPRHSFTAQPEIPAPLELEPILPASEVIHADLVLYHLEHPEVIETSWKGRIEMIEGIADIGIMRRLPDPDPASPIQIDGQPINNIVGLLRGTGTMTEEYMLMKKLLAPYMDAAVNCAEVPLTNPQDLKAILSSNLDKLAEIALLENLRTLKAICDKRDHETAQLHLNMKEQCGSRPAETQTLEAEFNTTMHNIDARVVTIIRASLFEAYRKTGYALDYARGVKRDPEPI